MKRLILPFLALFFLILSSRAGAFMIKGPVKTLDAAEYRVRGTEYLPLITVCDAYGIAWEWDPLSKTVDLNKDNTRLRMRVDEYRVYTNGVVSVQEKPVLMHKSAVYIPSDFLRTVFGRAFPVEVSRPSVVSFEPPPAVSYYKIRKIVIDAGHGGTDPGAIGRDGIKEKYIALDIARKVRDILEHNGIEVIMTRNSDKFIPLWQRSDIANRAGADLFVSIHANASRTKRLKGFEVYHLSEAIDDSARAATAADDGNLDFSKEEILDNSRDVKNILWDIELTEDRRDSVDLGNRILDETSVKKRGLKSARFYVLKFSRMPAVLVEVGYISNAEECSLLGSDTYRTKIANQVAEGILSYKRRFERSDGFTR